ncbi:hypothetical protein Misp01_42470 [Microtetraspora sp. NBRC 13810]|uniref:hypothetical protein n=1 Tax=Microtetraspora sp. NBRC 13810 TaxID=3030990 RepID=UPI00249FB878|nr:hypothetical protein [Microtetraspora sp. NBRC 13810]GLW09118.1 hypothetical protein Misp01_42470 [Microtetraspora sp. NBRC 13810]
MRAGATRTLVIAAVLAALAGPGSAAHAAGAWAVTYLDPVPARVSAGTSHTLGLWVLENARHPVRGGDPGRIALRFTDGKGAQLTFAAVKLPEAAHYAVAFSLPKGTYRIHSMQGVIAPHALGTLTVPGPVTPGPLPRHLQALDGQVLKDHWGAVRPPGFPAVGGGRVKADSSAMLATLR